jgi:hypothetical protein
MGQADRATGEFRHEDVELAVAVTRQVDETRQVLALPHVCACISDLATRSRDPTSESLKPIQSARAVCLPRAKPRRVPVLRAFTWPRLFRSSRP